MCPACQKFYEVHPFDAEPGDPQRGRHRGTNYVSPIKCAFPAGEFVADNWNCLSLGKVREVAAKNEVWSEDQNAAVLPLGMRGHLVVGYYKHRGQTELLLVIDGKTARNARLEDLRGLY